jgi:bla regulator protein blaR1
MTAAAIPDITWRVLVVVMNHLWQSTLVVVAAWLLCRIAFASNHPRVRFVIWLAASLKFLIPFALFVGLGQQLGVRPVLTTTQSQQVFHLVSDSPTMLGAVPFQVAMKARVTSSAAYSGLPAIIVLWAVGVVFVVATWIRGWRRVRRASRDAIPAGQFRGIPVLESRTMREQRIEPGVVGIWRQTILLPGGLDQRLSEPQLHSVLLHEWHHARRRDNLAAALHMIVEAVFWFYPPVWWVGGRLIEERERACDHEVLEQAGRADYAEGILNVCKWYYESPLPCVAGITGADLRARVESVLRCERPPALTRSKRAVLVGAFGAMLVVPLVTGMLTAPAVFAQATNSFLGMAASANKKFEVATVKRSSPDQQGGRLGPPGHGGITIVNLPLRGIITQSFRTQRWMVFGGPDWISDERYDIVGKGPDPTATNPEVWEMMRSLLIERFHLKYHIEDREMPVFALVVGKNGHKLIAGEKGRCSQEIKEGKNCGDILVPPFGTGIYNMPIGALVTGLAGRAGRPVVDRTGLTGKYDINLSWMPENMTPAQLLEIQKEIRPEEVTLFEAVEQQAGLRLEPSRAVMPVLVIDSVDHPTEN